MRNLCFPSRWILHAIIYLAVIVTMGHLLATQSLSQSLVFLGLLVTWVFLGIPACCGGRR